MVSKTESEKLIDQHHTKVLKCYPEKGLKNGERITFLTPAFEARDPNPSKNYGIGGVDIIFAERRGSTVIDCRFLTPLHLPEVQARLSQQRTQYFRPEPTGFGFYYHYKTKKQAGEYAHKAEDCLLLKGKCYGEVGSALYGDELTKRLLVDGSAGIWDEIDRAFKEILDTKSTQKESR